MEGKGSKGGLEREKYLGNFLGHMIYPKLVGVGEGRAAAYSVLHLSPRGTANPSASAHLLTPCSGCFATS